MYLKFFYNGYNYDYHFIIKELAEEFEGQFTSLGENTTKYITFFSSNGKRSYKIDKNGKEITKTISCRLQFLAPKYLWQARYQILLMELIKLNVNTDTIKNWPISKFITLAIV